MRRGSGKGCVRRFRRTKVARRETLLGTSHGPLPSGNRMSRNWLIREARSRPRGGASDDARERASCQPVGQGSPASMGQGGNHAPASGDTRAHRADLGRGAPDSRRGRDARGQSTHGLPVAAAVSAERDREPLARCARTGSARQYPGRHLGALGQAPPCGAARGTAMDHSKPGSGTGDQPGVGAPAAANTLVSDVANCETRAPPVR